MGGYVYIGILQNKVGTTDDKHEKPQKWWGKWKCVHAKQTELQIISEVKAETEDTEAHEEGNRGYPLLFLVIFFNLYHHATYEHSHCCSSKKANLFVSIFKAIVWRVQQMVTTFASVPKAATSTKQHSVSCDDEIFQFEGLHNKKHFWASGHCLFCNQQHIASIRNRAHCISERVKTCRMSNQRSYNWKE